MIAWTDLFELTSHLVSYEFLYTYAHGASHAAMLRMQFAPLHYKVDSDVKTQG